MNVCPSEELLQAHLDGELTAQVGDEINTHLAACPRCAALAQEMVHTFALMGSAFAVELPDAIPTARLRARIETALAEPAAPRWTQWFWRLGWAAAALLIVGLIGWAWLGRHSIQPQPQEARTETPPPTAPPTPVAPVPGALELKPELARQSLRPRLRKRVSRNEAQKAEAVTEFYPLREGADLAALATMQWVRVELPSSALSEVGLPVAPETVNTRIKADVALGEDGLARAIRFVR
jgi:anti-sigma factor RsiW